MRLHGNRNRHGEKSNLKEPSGDPNELWSFGERIFEILKNLVFLRERLRPYIEHHMKIASEKGYPVMRPMFFDFPDDKECYTLGEQYMFGDDILFAPIVPHNVYLGDYQWMMIFSLPIMLLYNNRQGRKAKYLFYIYYLVHIVLLCMLSNIM